jgi:hypothetical protein
VRRGYGGRPANHHQVTPRSAPRAHYGHQRDRFCH